MYFDDSELGVRPNPLYDDHDASGWRNASDLGDVDVVAVGDSQTYGLGVKKSDAWPQRLAAITGRSVYQIAFGGYGIPQYLRLADSIFAHKPETIIVGLYTGGNFSAAFLNVYRSAPTPEIAFLRSSNLMVLNDLRMANLNGGGWTRARYLDCQRPIPEPRPVIDELVDAVTSRSALVRELGRRLAKARPPEMQPSPVCIRYDGAVPTILTAPYRLLALETSDPRNVEGERITIKALLRLADLAKRHGARLIVLLISTKELVFREALLRDAFPVPDELSRLWEMETAARERVVSALRAKGIEVADSLPHLSGMVLNGVDPYQGAGPDGHPSAVGYDAIAQTVSVLLHDD